MPGSEPGVLPLNYPPRDGQIPRRRRQRQPCHLDTLTPVPRARSTAPRTAAGHLAGEQLAGRHRPAAPQVAEPLGGRFVKPSTMHPLFGRPLHRGRRGRLRAAPNGIKPLSRLRCVCIITMSSREGASEHVPSFNGPIVRECGCRPAQWRPDRRLPSRYRTCGPAGAAPSWRPGPNGDEAVFGRPRALQRFYPLDQPCAAR